MQSERIRSLEDAVRLARALEPAGLGIYVADWSGIAALCDHEDAWRSGGIDRWLRAQTNPGAVLAAQLRLCYVSPALRKYWGSEDLESLSQIHKRIIAALGMEAIHRALSTFVRGGSQLNFETPGGGEEWVRPVWLVPPSRATPFGVTLLLQVEPARASTHELRRSEARYRAIVEDHTDFIVRYRPDGVRTFVNDAYAAFFGGTPGDFVGSSFLDLIADEHLPAVKEKIRQLCDREIDVLADEHLSLRYDGERRWTHWLDRAIFDDVGNLVELQAVGRDITEHKEAEERRLRFERQLAQAQKMEAMGTLAGGLAHDFNNTLTAIGAYSELVRSNAQDAAKVTRYAGNLLEAANQASQLVRNLLQLSSRTPRQLKPCRISEVVESAGRLLRGVVPRHIELIIEVADIPATWADSGQLTQALVNLGLNARDAMADKGRLRITAARRTDGIVLIRVSDTGSGIPEEVRSRVFEPFFTTKAEGQGTGLGLAMVYACARAHGGEVEIDSESGVGTTVELRLPLAGAAVAGQGDEDGIRSEAGLVD